MLFIVVLASIAAIMSYRAVLIRFDTELRVAVQKHLSDLFPQARVYIQRVSKDPSGKIIAEGVRMATVIDDRPYQVFGADEVVVQGNLDVTDFLKQTISVKQIDLIGVQIDAWMKADGKWSVECLKPRELTNKNAPKIVLNDSLIRIRQGASPKSPELVVHGVSATIETLQPGDLIGMPQTQVIHKTLKIHGTAQSSGLLEKVNVEFHLDMQTQAMQLAGNFNGLQFNPRLREKLPVELSDKLKQFAGLECELSSSYFSVKLAPGQPAEFVCQGRLESGRLQDQRLPYPIEQIQSDFYCRNSFLQLRNMQARSGTTKLTFETDILGFGLDSPMDIQAQVENLELDQRLYQSLPPAVQQQWDKLQLAGRVSGRLKLQFDGQQWRPSALIQCQQVSIKPWLFPYAISHIDGDIEYREGILQSGLLRGRAGGQLIEGTLRLKHVAADAAISSSLASHDGKAVPVQGLQWLGKLNFRSLGAVAIDEDLIAALTPVGKVQSGAERFVRSLRMTGSIELLNATFERDSIALPKWHRTLEAHVYDARLKYEKFPFPVYNLRGAILNQGDQWKLDGFEGRNDSARILCSGSWQQVPQGLLPFKLEFVAHTVPIVEDLFYALPTKARQVWEELQPSGSIDQVTATIERPLVDAAIESHVVLREERDSVSTGGRSLRLYPKKLPYLLDDVSGVVTYNNGIVQIEQISAQNGATRIVLKGQCYSLSQDQWQADIQWLPSTRLMVDSQLVRALPPSIQESMNKLAFYGPVSVLGGSRAIFSQNSPHILTSWDCVLDIEDGRLASGAHIGAMRGTILVRGNSNGESINANGQVSMDAVRVLKTPVTNLQGPFVILDNKLYFGSTVQEAIPSPDPNNLPVDLTASALAGTLKLSGYGRLDTGKFFMDAKLENAHLSALLRDIGMQSQTPEATCNASLKFQGIPWNSQTFDGSGEIHLTDAKLYELPFMMRFLSVASVNASDASAFQRADISFRLDGDHIPLQVSADGEVLRLRGEGWTNLRKDVELQLYTYVGRRVPIGKIIAPLVPESQLSTFMMIEVTGSLNSPDMQRRAFPQIEATLQQMFPEVAQRQPLRNTLQMWRQ